MGKKLLIVSFVFSGLLVIVGLAGIIFGDKFIHNFVTSSVKLTPGSELFNQWLNPPIDVYMSFYLFNLKNPQEFEKGAKPMFEEIGPFVFREYITKEDIVDNLNFTITYKERKRYTFVPEMSPYEISYPITTLNMGPITIIDQIRFQPNLIHSAVNIALKLVGDTLLVTNMSANDVLFGYKDKFLVELKKLVPSLVPTDTVGLFIGKNDTIDGLYTIFTGADDYNKVGVVQRFNYEDTVNDWATPYANMLNGTDGTILPPYLNKSSVIYIFENDLCRSLYAVYNTTTTVADNIKLYGYAPDEYFFANHTVNPDNAGFCTPAGNCLPAGLLNLTNCLGGIPIIMTCPHFLFCDERYPKQVDGVKPNFTIHHTSIFAEPTTGVLMKANKRIQFNTQLFRDSRIDMAKNIPEVLYPLFWVDEHFEIDKKNADKFYRQVKLPLSLISVGKFVLFGVGLLLICVAFGFAYFGKKSNDNPRTNTLITYSNDERAPLLNKDDAQVNDSNN